MTVGFQGEPGAFSEGAATELFGAVATRGYPTFDALVHAVANEDVAYGLLPCENTIAGSIARAYDVLYASSGVHVVDEIAYRIEQALIGVPGACIESLETVSSHPVALDQCRRFISRYPRVRPVVVDDTAGAVRAIVERGDARHAAIGPAGAAERYGGAVLAASIADDPENFTRFFAISRDRRPRRSLGRASMSFVVPHEPGSLRTALGAIAERGMNLRSLVARPRRGRAFEYVFHADIEAVSAEEVAALAACLGSEARVLGWY